jgi:hypothetical protein
MRDREREIKRETEKQRNIERERGREGGIMIVVIN